MQRMYWEPDVGGWRVCGDDSYCSFSSSEWTIALCCGLYNILFFNESTVSTDIIMVEFREQSTL